MSKTTALRAARVALAIGAVLMLAGCTRGMSDLRDWVAQEKSKKGAPIPPLPLETSSTRSMWSPAMSVTRP